jgi:hypothetical protein
MNSSDYMNSYVPLCVFVPEKELNCLTDSHIKLNSLDDMQECLNNSNHKVAFDYDEDNVSLVVDPSLSTSYISITNNSDSSTGNTSAFEYECYGAEDDTP